jgi:group I intron endonuclease
MIIYKVTNNISGKVYIGQTFRSLNTRKWQHISDRHRNRDFSYFHQALNKYGPENFTWEVLEHCDSKEELDEMEFHYIKQYNSLRPSGYNLTLGGDGRVGTVMSEESKLRISINKKGKKLNIDAEERKRRSLHISGVNNPCFKFLGKAHNQEKKFRIETPIGDILIISGLRNFCRSNSLIHSCMINCANGFNKQHKGYKCFRCEEKRS